MPYLTPDSVPTGRICRTISIPDSVQWLELVNGALSELMQAFNYEQYGTLTPEETAVAAQGIFWEYHGSECELPAIIGEIREFAFTTPEPKWLECVGQAISRTTYAALFAKIGTTYGVGNGSTTFNIPDFSHRSPMGRDVIIYTMGAKLGEEVHNLSVAEMPAHHHAQRMRNGNNMLLAGGSTNRVSVTSTTEFNLTTPIDTADTGSGSPHNTVHPVLIVSFHIFTGVL